MPKVADSYVIEIVKGYFRFSLTSSAGLPKETVRDWKRRAFSTLPDALAAYRLPKTEYEAKRSCRALIDWLKAEGAPKPEGTTAKPIIPWLLDFWTPESEYARHKALVEKAPLSGAYIQNSRRNVELYIAPYPPFAAITVGDLTKKLVKPWLVWLAEKGLSGRKINVVRQTIQVPVHDAWKNEEIPAYPFLGIEKAYHEARERGILTPAEVEHIEAASAAEPFSRLAVLLAARCGLRKGEVRGLQWGDIADSIITVRHNYVDADGLKGPKTRGGVIRQKTRKVLVVATVETALDAARKAAKFTGAGDFVIQTLRRRGEPVPARYCNRALEAELAAIGITHEEQKRRNLTFHGLRHTFVTLGRLAGLTDAEIQALAGHAGGRMMENYSHVSDALDFAALKAKLDAKERKEA